MKMTGGQLLVATLALQEVGHVFCVPGESYLPVLDAFHDRQDEFNLVVCRQEGGAANMAEAHGKLTGRPGVCFVTRGPGATNASTGVHTAFQDSTPMVLLVGQVARSMRDREGFQEIDFAAMFGPMAKWAAEISDARRIPEYVHRAFQVAMSGRPGPVVLSLPEDMLAELVEAPADLGLKALPIPNRATQSQIEDLGKRISEAARPVMIVGGGGWSTEASALLAQFALESEVAIVSSLRCQDYIDNAHANYVGHLAIGADLALVKLVQSSDLVIALGTRLGEMTTAGYTMLTPPRPGVQLVHIHPGADELGRVYQADLAINASQIEVLKDLVHTAPKPRSGRAEWIAEAHSTYLKSLHPLPSEAQVNLGDVVQTLRAAVPGNAIVCSGAGNYTGWFHRHWDFTTYRTQLAPTSGTMGYGVPAAVAAAITHPGRVVIAAAGDGCFQMHCQELATAAQYGAKVIFIVVNNSAYGTIRMHQEREYPGRPIATQLVNPDFVKFADSYGIAGTVVHSTAEFAAALAAAQASSGSFLIEIVTDVEQITARATLSTIRSSAMARQAEVGHLPLRELRQMD